LGLGAVKTDSGASPAIASEAPAVAHSVRTAQLQSRSHHLGQAPKSYRQSKTGLMLSDFPHLDFRAEDNSGVPSQRVPAGTSDIGVFRCRACGARFQARISNRVRLRQNRQAGELCGHCSGWLPAPGNSLADLPPCLLSQLRLPEGIDPRRLPIKGGTQRKYLWVCPQGHKTVDRVCNRLAAHRNCTAQEPHNCGCGQCGGRWPSHRATAARTITNSTARSGRPALAVMYHERVSDLTGWAL
jgi:hypothetical protein